MQSETEFPDVEVSSEEDDGTPGIAIYSSITDGAKVVTANVLLIDPQTVTPEDVAEHLVKTILSVAATYGSDTWIALQHRLSS